MRWSWPVGAAFYAFTDKEGKFQFSVNEDSSYDLMVDDLYYISDFAPLTSGHVNHIKIVAHERHWVIEQANHADESALRKLCVPIAGNGVLRLANSLHTALAVGFGESTHGTREYTELRRQVIERLARDGWLTTIALEASWEEVARIDDYVRRSKGTGRDAVKQLAYWPWTTEEFLAFVEAIRKLNDGLPPERKIEFVGVDYSPPDVTTGFLRSYLKEFRSALPDMNNALGPLSRLVQWSEMSKLSQQEREELLRILKELRDVTDSIPQMSLATILGIQITELILESRASDNEFRDPVMAKAILMLLSRSDKQRRIAIWAHDLHLAEAPTDGRLTMGHYLNVHLADKYRAVGTMFYEGSFLTYSGLQEKVVTHTVTLPPPFYFESTLHRMSPSGACVLDIQEAIQHPRLRDWISVPKHVRFYGAVEISESYPWPPIVVPDLWSALIFVPSTTPTTQLD